MVVSMGLPRGSRHAALWWGAEGCERFRALLRYLPPGKAGLRSKPNGSPYCGGRQSRPEAAVWVRAAAKRQHGPRAQLVLSLDGRGVADPRSSNEESRPKAVLSPRDGIEADRPRPALAGARFTRARSEGRALPFRFRRRQRQAPSQPPAGTFWFLRSRYFPFLWRRSRRLSANGEREDIVGLGEKQLALGVAV
jgi:hypothetical protein